MRFYTIAFTFATIATAIPLPQWTAPQQAKQGSAAQSSTLQSIASSITNLLTGSPAQQPQPAPNQPPPYQAQPQAQGQPYPYSNIPAPPQAGQPYPSQQYPAAQPYPAQPYPAAGAAQPFTNQPFPNQPPYSGLQPAPQPQQQGKPTAKPAGNVPYYQNDKANGLTLSSGLGTLHRGPDGTYVKGGLGTIEAPKDKAAPTVVSTGLGSFAWGLKAVDEKGDDVKEG